MTNYRSLNIDLKLKIIYEWMSMFFPHVNVSRGFITYNYLLLLSNYNRIYIIFFSVFRYINRPVIYAGILIAVFLHSESYFHT